jgi:hypothetical protein
MRRFAGCQVSQNDLLFPLSKKEERRERRRDDDRN